LINFIVFDKLIRYPIYSKLTGVTKFTMNHKAHNVVFVVIQSLFNCL